MNELQELREWLTKEMVECDKAAKELGSEFMRAFAASYYNSRCKVDELIKRMEEK